MKAAIIFALSLFVFTPIANAFLFRTQPVSGHGTVSGPCSGGDFMCISNLKRRAERDAEQDAMFSCRARGGNRLSGLFFSTSCTPNYLPPDADQTWVHCRSDCRGSCID